MQHIVNQGVAKTTKKTERITTTVQVGPHTVELTTYVNKTGQTNHYIRENGNAKRSIA